MSHEPPMAFTWDGEHMVPRKPKYADKVYTIGENYLLAPIEERSEVSHRHEFAFLREAWLNLPEDLAPLYPTSEHLRKRALIDTGWYNEKIIDAGTESAAIEVASILKDLDEFSLVIVRGSIVVRRTAKSQSRRKMNKEDFQKSKNDILELVSAMIGVKPEEIPADEPVTAGTPDTAGPPTPDGRPDGVGSPIE